jgi:transcriptional regulator with XRE-family HTH domain
MTKFSERLRQTRQEKGWNQEQLAEAMDLSQSAISQFEKGLRIPTPANITKFSEILGVSRDTLVGEEEMMTEKVKLMRSIQSLSPDGLKRVKDYVSLVKKSEGPSEKAVQ